QSGVRMTRGEDLGELGELFHVRAQLLRTERAVESHGEGAGMAHRAIERLGRLAGERAPRGVGNCARDDDGQARAAALERLLDGKERGLGVERIEYGLDEQYVYAPLEQPLQCLTIGRDKFIEADRAKAGIVDIGRDGSGL